jgi:hypothetical protein
LFIYLFFCSALAGAEEDDEQSQAYLELSGVGSVPTSLYPPTVPYLMEGTHNTDKKSRYENDHEKSQENESTKMWNLGGGQGPESSKAIYALCETIFSKEIKIKYAQKVKKSAINIIRNLFLMRLKDIEYSVKNIPCIPDIPELKSVQMIHTKKISELNLDQNLRILCQLLMHDSSFVRRIVLTRIHDVFTQNRGLICGITSGDVSTGGGVYVLPVGSAVSMLLQELLQLCSRETDPAAINMCAKCLGE